VGNNASERILQNFQAIGFTIYGAKAYLCMLQQEAPLTGYEIGKKASIPRSKIYEVMDQLLERHVVMLMSHNPRKYLPRNPDEVLSTIHTEYSSRISFIKEDLKNIHQGETVDFIVNLFGKTAIIEKAREIIANAKKSILMAACPEMLNTLKTELRQAEKRSIELHIVVYSTEKTLFKRSYSHMLNQPDIKRFSYLLLDRDFEEVLAGTMYRSSNYGYGIWTKNVWMKNILHDNIIHEIYLGIMEKKLGVSRISKLAGIHPARLWDRAARKFHNQFHRLGRNDKSGG
jgi:sugar-specific transcriptional regulator TrmB